MAFFRVILVLVLYETSVVAVFGQDDAKPDLELLFSGLVHPDLSIRKAATDRLKEVAGGCGKTSRGNASKGRSGRGRGGSQSFGGNGRERFRPSPGTLVDTLHDSQIEDWRWSVAAGVLGKIDQKRSGLLELFVARLQSDSPLVQSASLEAITAIALDLPDNQPDQFTEALLRCRTCSGETVGR